MKRFSILIAVLLLFILPSSASGLWAGWKWHVANTPPTVVPLYDDTPYPLSNTVKWAADQWSNATNVFKLEYHHIDKCGRYSNGILWVCAYYLPGASASWTQMYLNGKNNTNVQKAVVTLNTWHDIFHEPKLSDPTYELAREYLVCHEMGGGIGLQEFKWPVGDYYHYGCMNLQWTAYGPSPDDIDTLNTIYTP